MKDMNDTPSLGLSKGNSGKFIPEDVLTQFLVRLPVKSLMRFKAVRRSWRNLISSPVFAEMHLRHSKATEQILGVGLHSERHYQIMTPLKLPGSKDAESGDGFSNIPLPLQLLVLESVVIEGSCNGLLVFRAKNSGGIWLGNPATREFRHLGLPFHEIRFSTSIGRPPTSEFCTSIGFCFISETNDYKIVAIRNRNGERSISGKEISYPGWVYSLNSDSWKKLDVAFPYIKNRLPGFNGMAIVFNECLHWIADEDEARIVAFDVKNEALQYILLPVSEHLIRKYGRTLAIIEGSLSFIVSTVNEVRHLGFEVWKMNEYGVEASWTKMFVISKFQIRIQTMGSLEDITTPISIPLAMGSWKDKMLLFKYYWGKDDLLFSYDPYTEKRERFLVPPVLNLQVINFVESLESVEGGKRRISQSRMMDAGTSHGSDSTGVVISGGQEKHVNTTLESSSNNIEGETTSKGKRKLE